MKISMAQLVRIKNVYRRTKDKRGGTRGGFFERECVFEIPNLTTLNEEIG